MDLTTSPQEIAPVVVIGCTGPKANTAQAARDLYQGRNFGLTLAAALAEVDQDADRVFILSAGHGLVRLSTVLEPYEATVDPTSRPGVIALVASQAAAFGLADHPEVYAMVSNTYFDVLRDALELVGTYPTPVFEGNRGIGDQRHVMAHSLEGEAR